VSWIASRVHKGADYFRLNSYMVLGVTIKCKLADTLYH
jgi:hypothetical protein